MRSRPAPISMNSPRALARARCRGARLRCARAGDDGAPGGVQQAGHRCGQRARVRRRMRDHRGRASRHREREGAVSPSRKSTSACRRPSAERSACRGSPGASARSSSSSPASRFTPARALEIGLVNRVVPHDALLPPHTISRAASSAIRRSRSARIITAVTRGLNMSIGEGLQVESEQFAGWRRRTISAKASRPGSRGGSRSIADGDAPRRSILCSRKLPAR